MEITLSAIAQRAAYAALPMASPGFALAQRWCRAGFRLDPTAFEDRAMRRLRRLVGSFRRAGICLDPGFDAYREVRGFRDLRLLPILTRKGLQQRFGELERIYRGRRGIYENRTGGSTGEPVHYLRSKGMDRACRGATHETMGILGWQPGMKRLCLWGSDRDIGLSASQPWYRALMGNAVVFGGFRCGEAEYLAFYDEVRRSPGCAVYGYTSLLEDCARTLRERGLRLPAGHVRAAWVGGEMLFDRQRELFEQVFGAPLRNLYGSRECEAVAAECREGSLHVNPRYVLEATPVDGLEKGQGALLVTDLFNSVTPLLRYQIGDLGHVEPAECRCGRRGQVLARLAGRVSGLIELSSGHKVSHIFFSHLLKEYAEIRQFQTVRCDPDRFEIRYSGLELPAFAQQRIVERTSVALEGATVEVVRVDELEKSPTGKLRHHVELSKAGAPAPGSDRSS